MVSVTLQTEQPTPGSPNFLEGEVGKDSFSTGVLLHLLAYLQASNIAENYVEESDVGPPPGLGALAAHPPMIVIAGKAPTMTPTTSSSVCSRSPSVCDLSESDEDEKESTTLMVQKESTTLMVRNIPNKCDRSKLLALFDSHGFQGTYDFVYLPIDYESHTGLGYAFVDFVTHEDADRFKSYFNGFKKWGMPSRKCCDVMWSTTMQGLQAHTDRFRDSDVMHDSVPDAFKPIILSHGQRVPFPAPTKRLRQPKARRHGGAKQGSQ